MKVLLSALVLMRNQSLSLFPYRVLRKCGTRKCPGHLEVTMDVSRLPPPSSCQASEVLGRVGDKWSLQVIFSLGEGTKRFTDLKRGISGISQRMLTVTLRGLERDGIISRTMYPVMPPRVDY